MGSVVKRDGSVVDFDKTKIVKAIRKANKTVSDAERLSDGDADRISVEIEAVNSESTKQQTVEDIQDLVERKIQEAGKFKLAKNYIKYRYERELARQNDSVKEKLLATNVQNQNANVDEHSFGGRMGEALSLVSKKYALENVVSKKSARNHNNNEIYIHDLDSYAVGMHNCLSIPFDKLLAKGFDTRQCDIRPAGSINTAMQLVAVIFQVQSLQQFGGVSATHLDWTMVPYVRLSFFKHYQDGLKFICKVSVDESTSKEVVKCTSIDNSDFYENEEAREYALTMTVRELSQSVEGLYHNLNTLQSRSGCQLPFTSINYGTCALTEGRMVTKALLDGSINGVGKFHKTPIFPCGIFQCKEGVNRKPGDPNYDLFKLALRSTALRLYPNYSYCGWSVDNLAFKTDRKAKKDVIDSLSDEEREMLKNRLSENPSLKEFLMLEADGDIRVSYDVKPFEIVSTMGCRTYNGFDINSIESYEKNVKSVIKDGTLYDDVMSGVAKDGRGNISPVTIIMPTLAMQAKLKVKKEIAAEKKGNDGFVEWPAEKVEDRQKQVFMELLAKKIGEAKDMLLERFEWQCSQSPKAARFMYENGTMSGYRPEEGVRSALKHGTIVIGQLGLAETLQILIGCDHTCDKGMALAKEIEGLFKAKCAEYKNELKMNFGVYYTPAENLCYTAMKKFKAKYGEIKDVSDREFFTNSMHVPVWKKMTPFEKIDIESQLTGYSSAGCITYVELDSSTKNNTEALEELVNYAMDKDIPYFAVNTPNDACDDCGYTDDIPEKCPKCGSTRIKRLRRVTGYLTGSFTEAFNKGKQEETLARVKHGGVEA